MSVDPGALHSEAEPAGGPRVVRSLLRAGAFGATAAVAGAAVLAGAIILVGWDVIWFAPALGVTVGMAAGVASGEAGVGRHWIGALSVLLTQLGLMLCSYLVLWLYRADRFEPVPISVADASVATWARLVEAPVGLVFWGLTLVVAFNTGSSDTDDVDDARDASPAVGFDGPWPVVQVVAVYANPARAADLELAVVMRSPRGSFCLRQVSLAASDLPAALRHLADPDTDALRHGRGLAHPCEVSDQVYASADAAMTAAHEQEPEADPDDWIQLHDLGRWVEEDPDFAELLQPSAGPPSDVGIGVAVTASITVASVVVYGGYHLNVWVGLDTPARRDTLPDHVYTVALLALAGALAFLTWQAVVRYLARRVLQRARVG